MERNFEFELFRINIIKGERTLFDSHFKRIKKDNDIVTILKASIDPEIKQDDPGKKNLFEWVVRDFCKYSSSTSTGEVYGLSLGKALVAKTSEIITDTGIEEGHSISEPAAANSSRLFFCMNRHLLAIERSSDITSSRKWTLMLKELLKQAAIEHNYLDWIVFEPVARKQEIFEIFNSFERLTRFRVTLRLPNPELSRYSEQLFSQMEEGGVREYLQDMKNPQGLSKGAGKLPHATAEIASSGYKKGDLIFEGVRNRKRARVKTGKNAARGEIKVVKDYVRGLKDNAKSKEAKNVTLKILEEIERISPAPETKKNG